MVMDHSEQANESSNTDSSESTQSAAQFNTATKGSGPMNSKERATERANEVKERLVQAGTEARKRFAGTKLGQRVEQTVSQLEIKFPELKTNLQAKAEERLTAFAHSATEAGDLARNVAKAQVDQVLLNLQHKGLDLSHSNELVQKIGKSVLRRADEVRERLEGSPMAPEWLKDLKLGDKIEGLSQKLAENFGTAPPQDNSEAVHATAAAFSDKAAESETTSETTSDMTSQMTSKMTSKTNADTVVSAAEAQKQTEPEMPTGEITDSILHAVAGDEHYDAVTKSTKVKTGKKARPTAKH